MYNKREIVVPVEVKMEHTIYHIQKQMVPMLDQVFSTYRPF